MTTIAEIRRQHPEYNDMSDAQIAHGLHDRYYADIPFEDFSRRVGLTQQAPAAPRRTEWSPQERQAVGRDTAGRYIRRDIMPFGAAIEPMVSALTDPRQRAAVGRNVDGFVNGVRQIPSLDLPRLARDQMASGVRAVQGAPQAAVNALTHIPELIHGMTTQPFEQNDEARNQELVLAMRGNQAGADREAGNAVAATGGIMTNMTGAIAAPMISTRLGGAALGAGLTLPNALAQGQGSLQERLPQALTDTVTGGLLGAVLSPSARRGRIAPPPAGAAADEALRAGTGAPSGIVSAETPASRLADFEAARVRPSAAAVYGGSSADITKTASESWLGGMTARRGVERANEDIALRARELAQRTGFVQSPEGAGTEAQGGIRRSTSDRDMARPHGAIPMETPIGEWSFPAQAEALYQPIFDQLAHDERQMTGHVEGPVVVAHNTIRAIDEIGGRVRGGASREALAPRGFLSQMRDALATDTGPTNQSLSFDDLRTWRTALRERMNDPGLRGDTSSAQLQQAYSALTKDIAESAHNIGGQAAEDLARVDDWYAHHARHIEAVLEPINKLGRGIGGGHQVYHHIWTLARDAGRKNTAHLAYIRQALHPDEMRTVAATLLHEMGTPTFGSSAASDAGAFSVRRFATHWSQLSEEGKAHLFPPELRHELDALGRVAKHQQAIEEFANNSRSGRQINNMVVTGGAAAIAGAGGWQWVLMGIAGMNGVGYALTNPGFVRLLVRTTRTRATAGVARRWLADLAALAVRDPSLVPVYNRLARAQPGAEPAPTTEPQSAPLPRLETAQPLPSPR